MKKQTLLFFLALVLSMACQREDSNNQNTPVGSVDDFDEIVVSDDFRWNTIRKFTLNVEGAPGLPFDIVRLLEVENEAGDVIFSKLIKIGENQNLRFEAAAKNQQFTIRCGSLERTVAVSGNNLSFSFIPEVDNSDLDPGNL